MPKHRPRVSFILATYNRREVVTPTLARVAACGLHRRDFEIVVVDNASTDGTSCAIAGVADRVVPLRRNRGSCAKAWGVPHATGAYIVFLDDDSHPRPGAVARMMEHFDADPGLGAAGFAVHLPDGGREASALPGVFVGAGVGFRAEALRGVGGLDAGFFMQAEEYDLAFRLAARGWGVRVFDDIAVDHLKTPHARRSDRIAYCDIRNNLRVAARYLPGEFYAAYRDDWRQRYAMLAAREGNLRAHLRGLCAGSVRASLERLTYIRHRLPPAALEAFFRWEFVAQKVAELARRGVRRVVFADLGKNVLAFHRAARLVGVAVAAIGDDRFAAPERHYRGTPIVPLAEALTLPCDAVVVVNMADVHAAATRRQVAGLTDKPIYCWFAAETDAGRGGEPGGPPL
ncbi:MAG: glycosyltransferase [Planctomycetes bacterium]|nr:glycosyltransferase [Planctomycetota bacterium]